MSPHSPGQLAVLLKTPRKPRRLTQGGTIPLRYRLSKASARSSSSDLRACQSGMARCSRR